MSLLSIDASFKLLTLKVFGQQPFPPELERIGKQISDKCQGLLLAIVVAAGFLSKIKRSPYCWENVEKEINSHVIGQSKRCLDILDLSYNYLPHHLKPCFLYMGAFKHNLEISVSKLIRLWIAEGFACETSHKTLEEVAEEFLENLIKRNLIVATMRKSDGRVRTCGIHDLLRDLIIRKAQEVGFLHVIKSSSSAFPENSFEHRVSFYSGFYGIVSTKYQYIISRKYQYIKTRSILCFGRFDVKSVPLIENVFSSINFRLLRVLDILFHPFDHFPEGVLELKFLRYLALATFSYIPSSVAKLCYLQTLVRHSHEEDLVLPTSMWKLKQLRHLFIKKCSILTLPAKVLFLASRNRDWPTLLSSTEQYLCLRNLQTLSHVSLSSCARLGFSGIPNLKKLGVRERKDECENDKEMLDHLSNIKFLLKLETLKCFFIRPRLLPQHDYFPPNLKKLTLRGCHRLKRFS